MTEQQVHVRPAEAPAAHDALSAFLADCYQVPIQRLRRAEQDRRSLAVLVSEGRHTASFVLRSFLDQVDDKETRIRIGRPCPTAADMLRIVLRAAGFESGNMSPSDMRSVLDMFLDFQKSHGRRTVICLEEFHASDWWVLDEVRRLLESERASAFGLMFVLSGTPQLRELMRTRPLEAIADLADSPIKLASLSLEQTTEYVRRRIEANNSNHLEQAFEYPALEHLHSLSEGIPDEVGPLVAACLRQAEKEGLVLVTPQLVDRAQQSLASAPEPASSFDEIATITMQQMPTVTGRLVIRLSEDELQEKVLRDGRVLIGRSRLCDVKIDSAVVSRHHALLSYRGGIATLVDLGSTNGTYVNGRRVTEHYLVAKDRIRIGDSHIEYVIDSDEAANARDIGVESRRHAYV